MRPSSNRFLTCKAALNDAKYCNPEVDKLLNEARQAPDEAARLADVGREIFGTDPVFVSEIGPVIGAHVGPGLIGAGGVPRALVE